MRLFFSEKVTSAPVPSIQFGRYGRNRAVGSDDNAIDPLLRFVQLLLAMPLQLRPPFVAQDYMQTRLLANKLEQPLWRARFLTAVATAMLLTTQSHPQSDLTSANGSLSP